MSRRERRLKNFANALERLKEAVAELKLNHANSVIRDGVIQRFEFTYELAWKALKDGLEEVGITDRNSPKAIFQEAYAQQMVADEKIWLLLMQDRNMTSHIYKEELARQIAERIENHYLKEFEALLASLRRTE